MRDRGWRRGSGTGCGGMSGGARGGMGAWGGVAVGALALLLGVIMGGSPALAAQAPYGGTPRSVPGAIQAEDYDSGGEGVAYHDTTSGNSDSTYRADDVDIRSTSDEGSGNYLVKQIAAGEWLEYTVSVAVAGYYDVAVRAAPGAYSGKCVHVEFGGTDKTGSISLATTANYDSGYDNLKTTSASLAPGEQVMRLCMDTGVFNVMRMTLTAKSAAAPANVAATDGTYADKVRVTWNESAYAVGYKVFRAAANDSSGASQVGGIVSGASYDDASAIVGANYYYWVKAVSAAGDSGFSASNSGYRGYSGGTTHKMAMTLDNYWLVYSGNSTAADACLGGYTDTDHPHGGYTKTWPYYFHFDDPSDGYLYVVAWSDVNGAQGFLAQVEDANTSAKYYTGSSTWQVAAAGAAVESLDTVGEATAAIAAANTTGAWMAVSVGPCNEGPSDVNPWYTKPGINTAAQWIWFDSGGLSPAQYPLTPFAPGYDHGECLIFRTLALGVTIDAPASFPAYVAKDASLQLGCTVIPTSATGGTFTWSKVSGPGNVTFGPNVTAEDPTFSADAAGEYKVKVQYAKNGATAEATSGTIAVLNVVIDIPAAFPAYVAKDASLSLGCSVTPTVAGGTFAWSKVSGPGSVTFGPNATAEDPTFSADAAGEYTVKVQYAKNGTMVEATSGTIAVVCVDKIQYKIGETAYADAPATLYVGNGVTVDFKAIPNPAGAASWPNGKPVWGGTAGASGTGETKSVTFSENSTASTDYKSVTAECGNTVTANVVVCQIDSLTVDSELPTDNYDNNIPLNASGGTGDLAYKNKQAKVNISTTPDNIVITLDLGSTTPANFSGNATTTITEGETKILTGTTKGTYTITPKSSGIIAGSAVSGKVFEFCLCRTDPDPSPGTAGNGVVNGANTTANTLDDYNEMHAADIQMRRYAYFTTDPEGAYGSYLKAKLKVIQYFFDTSDDYTTSGLEMESDGAGEANLSVSLTFGFITVTLSQAEEERAWAAWRGLCRIKGPNDEDWLESPTGQVNLKSSDLPWGQPWKLVQIETSTSKVDYINHYQVGNSASRTTAESRMTCSVAAHDEDFHCQARALLGTGNAARPEITIDDGFSLEPTSQSAP